MLKSAVLTAACCMFSVHPLPSVISLNAAFAHQATHVTSIAPKPILPTFDAMAVSAILLKDPTVLI